MPDTEFGLMQGEDRSHWIRLRTLIMLRWIAIAGQLIAITVAQLLYNLQLDLGLCLLAFHLHLLHLDLRFHLIRFRFRIRRRW